jgi:hypothetical protein
MYTMRGGHSMVSFRRFTDCTMVEGEEVGRSFTIYDEGRTIRSREMNERPGERPIEVDL